MSIHPVDNIYFSHHDELALCNQENMDVLDVTKRNIEEDIRTIQTRHAALLKKITQEIATENDILSFLNSRGQIITSLTTVLEETEGLLDGRIPGLSHSFPLSVSIVAEKAYRLARAIGDLYRFSFPTDPRLNPDPS